MRLIQIVALTTCTFDLGQCDLACCGLTVRTNKRELVDPHSLDRKTPPSVAGVNTFLPRAMRPRQNRSATMFKKLLAFLAALVCFASLAKAEDVPDSMRFRFIEHQGIQWISAEGTITLATPNDFRMFVAQHHDQLYEGGPLVVLNSPGGNLAAGLTLGMAFRAAHIKTAVGATIGEGDAANQVTGSCTRPAPTRSSVAPTG